MRAQFDPRFGQELCDVLSAELGLVCSFMGEEGRIVASSVRSRIGTVHEQAARIMRREIDEYSVSREEAERSGVMREGLNMGIDFEGERLVSFAIAGPLEVVRPLAHLVRFCVTSLLRVRREEIPALPSFVSAPNPVRETVGDEGRGSDAGGASPRGEDVAATPAEPHAGPPDAADAAPTRAAAPPAAPASAAGGSTLTELLGHASETIEQSLSRLRDAVDHIDQGITMFDSRLRLVVWNRRFLELANIPEAVIAFGLSLEAMMRYYAKRAAYPPEAVEAVVRGRMARVRLRRAYRFEHVLPSGVVLEIVDRPLHNGGFVSTYTDVTPRRRAEQALRAAYANAERLVEERTGELRRSEQQLAQIVDGSSIPTFVIDAEHRVTHWNKACAHLTGLSAAQMLGRKDVWRAFYGARRPTLADLVVNGSTDRTLARHYQKFARSTLIAGALEAEMFFPRIGDGGRWLYLTAAPLRDADGRNLGAVETLQDVTDRRRAQQVLEDRVAERTAELTEQLHFLRQLIEAIPGPVFYKDAGGRYLGCNTAFEAVVGMPASELIGKTPHDVAPRELADQYRAADLALFAKPDRQIYEAKVRYADGEMHDVMFHKAVFNRPDGTVGGVVGLMVDITERKRMEENLRQAATVFASSAEGVIVSKPDGTIIAINRAFTEITGYEEDEVIGRNPRMLQSGRQSKAFYRALWDCLVRDGRWQGEIWNRRKSGEVYPEWLSIAAVYDDQGRVTNYVATFSDIAQRKQTEERIQLLAFSDPLTGLPNRRLLLDRLQRALLKGSNDKRYGALFFIDLDDFKGLNDTRGHDVGDLLLQQVAARLSGCVRGSDTVARFGGDEFVVVLESLSADPVEATRRAEAFGSKFLAALNEPYMLGQYEHHSTPSIGIALFGDKQDSLEELLKQADLAMYRAKGAGRNAVRLFDPEMQAALAIRVATAADLRQGLANNEFVLHYQPQVDASRRVAGAEALVRWAHSKRGQVGPAEFIPRAEETGLIGPLGEWILQAACAQLSAWASEPHTRHLTLAVNVSARQFRQSGFVAQVLAALSRQRVEPGKLKLELTESLLLEDVEETISKMTALKAEGVRLSLDDFGTGYSSLSYLKRLPLDELKIDGSFIRDVLVDESDAAIARTIIALAQSLGIGVIAEGVEDEEQLRFLAEHGCRAYQGYLFSPALPPEQFDRLLRHDHGRVGR